MKVNYGGMGWQYWYATIDDVMQGRAAGYTGSTGDQGDLDFSVIGAHIQPAWEGYEDNPRAVFNSHGICIPKSLEEDKKKQLLNGYFILQVQKFLQNGQLKQVIFL